MMKPMELVPFVWVLVAFWTSSIRRRLSVGIRSSATRIGLPFCAVTVPKMTFLEFSYPPRPTLPLFSPSTGSSRILGIRMIFR